MAQKSSIASNAAIKQKYKSILEEHSSGLLRNHLLCSVLWTPDAEAGNDRGLVKAEHKGQEYELVKQIARDHLQSLSGSEFSLRQRGRTNLNRGKKEQISAVSNNEREKSPLSDIPVIS